MSDRVKNVLFPAITFVIVIGGWLASLRIFEIPDYILPHPADVLTALKRGYVDGAHYVHMAQTLKAMVFGYAAGCGAAIALGALLAESRTFDRFVYPYIVALQSMPKVALAPLIIVWFGFGIESKIIMVALICFFPLLINTIVGIRQTNPDLIALMRAFSASRWHIFWHVKLPSAAGHIFAGLQIAVVLALIGAVVAEFVSARHGLGVLIQSASVDLNTSLMFACLIALAVLGIIGTQVIRFLHKKVVFWEEETTSTTVAEG